MQTQLPSGTTEPEHSALHGTVQLSLKAFGDNKADVLLAAGPTDSRHVIQWKGCNLGKWGKAFVIILKPMGFINQQVKPDWNSGMEHKVKLRYGLCCCEFVWYLGYGIVGNMELWEIRNRRRKMVETALVVYRNGNLVCA